MLLKIFCFTLCISSLSSAFDIEILGISKDTIDLDVAKIIYDDYLTEFDKNYSTHKEYQTRFNIFMEKIMSINKKNIEVGSKMFGLTQFTDLSKEELQHYVCGFVHIVDDSLKVNYSILAKDYDLGKDVPDSWDWVEQGAVTQVKDQHDCGSCWAFSSTGTIEGQYYIEKKQLLSFSEQELVDCIEDVDCDSGYYPVNAFNKMAQKPGVMTEEDYPYESRKAQCRLDKDKVRVRVQSGNTPLADENQMMNLLHTYGPVSIIITVTDDFFQYRRGIYDQEPCSPQQGLHAILLVGYGTENGTPFWKVKNSWNRSWGEDGYIRMIRGKNICGIKDGLATVKIL